jgi:hypothetical protein
VKRQKARLEDGAKSTLASKAVVRAFARIVYRCAIQSRAQGWHAGIPKQLQIQQLD